MVPGLLPQHLWVLRVGHVLSLGALRMLGALPLGLHSSKRSWGPAPGTCCKLGHREGMWLSPAFIPSSTTVLSGRDPGQCRAPERSHISTLAKTPELEVPSSEPFNLSLSPCCQGRRWAAESWVSNLQETPQHVPLPSLSIEGPGFHPRQPRSCAQRHFLTCFSRTSHKLLLRLEKVIALGLHSPSPTANTCTHCRGKAEHEPVAGFPTLPPARQQTQAGLCPSGTFSPTSPGTKQGEVLGCRAVPRPHIPGMLGAIPEFPQTPAGSKLGPSVVGSSL